MSQTRLEMNWLIELTNKEFALLLRVLGARMIDGDDELADTLCDRLTLQRASTVRDQLRQMDKLEHNVLAKIDNQQSTET